jgi:uncharacterized protein (TIGR02421 family)
MNESESIQQLSLRLVELQKPIRILDAVKWTDDIKEQFLKKPGSALPKVDQLWYQNRPLDFDGDQLERGFVQLEKDTLRTLGKDHPASSILLRMYQEYRTTARLLLSRGTPEFYRHSKTLFGSCHDAIHQGEPSAAEIGKKIKQALQNIERSIRLDDPDDIPSISGKDAAILLQRNLMQSMSCHRSHPAVVIDDGITADAAAGADKIKLREDAFFSKRELRLLEVHEGWVHVGTSLNGRAQMTCTFLSKGTPSSTITQEGLAVLIEIIAFASSPARQRRINNRVIAIEMAENGANFIDIYRFFIEQGFTPDDSYQFAARVFRGSTPEGLPFTKDIAYTKGFVLLYNFLRAAVIAGELELIPLIFCGKTALEDIGYLRQLYREGLLNNPAFIPPPLVDIHGLAAWICYDTVLADFASESLQLNYSKLFK